MSKRERTRQQIIDAAIKVIAESGRDGASILEITKVADVGNGTFYYHFKNKEEILLEDIYVCLRKNKIILWKS